MVCKFSKARCTNVDPQISSCAILWSILKHLPKMLLHKSEHYKGKVPHTSLDFTSSKYSDHVFLSPGIFELQRSPNLSHTCCAGVFLSSAWLCQQSYCHGAGAHRLLSTCPSAIPSNSGFSETTAWVQAKFCGKLPIIHITGLFILFTAIFLFSNIYEFVSFSLTLYPMGIKNFKMLLVPHFCPISTKLNEYASHGGIQAVFLTFCQKIKLLWHFETFLNTGPYGVGHFKTHISSSFPPT